MSDTDPTPGTPVTVGDRLAWFRGDAQTQSAAQLAALAQLAGVPAASIADLVAQLVALRGSPAEDLHTLVEGLYTQTNPRYPYLVSVIARLESVEDRLDRLQAAVGAVPYGDLELVSVRGLLYAILRALTSGGVAPGAGNQSPSTGYLVVGDRRFVTWGSITGIEAGETGVWIRPVEGAWSGYTIYIQTNDPAPRVHVGDEDDVGSPISGNTWIAVPAGTDWRAVSVATNYAATAYLRAPSVNFVTYQSGGNYGNATIINIAGFSLNQFGENIGNGAGHSFRFQPNTPTRVSGGPGGYGDPRIGINGLFNQAFPSFSLDTWYHFANPTTSFQFYSYFGSFNLDWADTIVANSTPIS